MTSGAIDRRGGASWGDVVIVGGGLAGLFTALKLAPVRVTVLSPKPLGTGASSGWAQGGIAAAIGEGDTPEAHVADTVRVGGGIVNENIARLVALQAADRIKDLLAYGVPLDRDSQGRLALSQEAAHSARRIVHVKGDQAGRAIMATLIKAAQETPSIRIIENAVAEGLVVDGRHVSGVFVRHGGDDALEVLSARATVLATGGIGALYAMTTNPAEARGDGLAMAARAGAVIADAEFVQFHPTALNVGRDPMPLATEALRGEGAHLINGSGERFMLGTHPDAELAPRDIVARAVHREVVHGRGAYLDCRNALAARMKDEFPSVYTACKDAGIDPAHDPIPIAPAAHYHMGGVLTDANGRTSVNRLWACGEVTCTGMHGANRLASNSLLEAVVMAARIAEDISRFVPGWHGLPPPSAALRAASSGPKAKSPRAVPEGVAELRKLMSEHVGMERSETGLTEVLARLDNLERQYPQMPGLQNMIVAARLVTVSALRRRESRGSHFRIDFPEQDPAQARHSCLTYDEAVSYAAQAIGGADEPVMRKVGAGA